jgi:two-component system phosphate regulon sensor histidine kinase PhoR
LIDQLTLAGRLKDEFLAIAAHELKTPLTTITAYGEMLNKSAERAYAALDDPPPTYLQQRAIGMRAIAVINGQSERMLRLVNQLVDVARLESGALTLERAPADLGALIRDVCATFQAITGRHTLTCTTSGDLCASIDSLRFEQIMTNLLDNALKYSPEGGAIEVVAARPPEASVITVEVRDQGSGIPPQERERVFDRFYQSRTPNRTAGLGLGLYITRQFVQMHGGTIEVSAHDGAGSTMRLRLPVEPAPQTSMAPV